MLNGQFAPTYAIPPGAFPRFSRRILPAAVCAALVLAGCASQPERQAPIVDLTEQPAGPSAAGGTYIVKPGDTFYGIARRNGVDAESLKRLNGISDPNHLVVGQVLRLPGGGNVPAAAAPQAAPVAPVASKPAEPVPLEQTPPAASGTHAAPPEQQPAPAATAAVPAVSAPPPASARAADAGLINWGWPAQGQISQRFSANSRGIDISGNPGDPVYAAADGLVKYSGNGLRGMGNLIIISHANGFISAYAHNQDLLVKMGQQVKRGAKIATVGQTDAVAPMLHFEIRRDSTPLDPLQYLPTR
jgi:lipoprotein NlpD